MIHIQWPQNAPRRFPASLSFSLMDSKIQSIKSILDWTQLSENAPLLPSPDASINAHWWQCNFAMNPQFRLLEGLLICRLVGWSASRLVGWSFFHNFLKGRVTLPCFYRINQSEMRQHLYDRLTDWQTDRLADWQTDRWTDRQSLSD